MTGSVGGKDGFFIADGHADKPGYLLVHLNNQRGPKGRFQTGAQQG
jgi:hypothetical protein